MTSTEKITSTQNAKIKNLKKLEKAGERKEQNLILIEGLREAILAHRADYELIAVFICDEIVKDKEGDYKVEELFAGDKMPEVYKISKAVYDSLAYREAAEGVIAVARPRVLALDKLNLSNMPLLLIMEGVEKPGNIGAMLRTCDAAGVDAIIICQPGTDIYNPNVIRSSLGTVFTNQIAVCEANQAIEYLKNKNIRVFAAEAEADKFHYQEDFKKGSAIVVGAEDMGLSNEWTKAAYSRIKIPMSGKIDSLNVSVSAAVLLYEARRQRMI